MDKNSRHTAALILNAWEKDGLFPDRLMGQVTENRSFVMSIVYGVIRENTALSWLASRLTHSRPAPKLRILIQIGIYQLMHMSGVEPYAAIHETVEAAKLLKGKKQAGFVNAVLRHFQREQEALLRKLDSQPPEIRFSHPIELIIRWTEEFGKQETEELCQWNNSIPEVTARINLTRGRLEDLMGRWKDNEVEATPHPFSPSDCVCLPTGTNPALLPGFDEGLFYIQDPSTLISVQLLNAKPGELIIDACASPGGKLVMAAEGMQGQGSITALEIHKDRTGRLEDNIERMAAGNAKVIQGDAAEWKPEGSEKFDAALLDVPCSNTGVIRRRPDARYRFDANRLRQLVETQYSILKNISRHIRKGGRIVYSTCSLEREENKTNIERFLSAHPDFHLEKDQLLLPPSAGTDGAYAALLIRSAI